MFHYSTHQLSMLSYVCASSAKCNGNFIMLSSTDKNRAVGKCTPQLEGGNSYYDHVIGNKEHDKYHTGLLLAKQDSMNIRKSRSLVKKIPHTFRLLMHLNMCYQFMLLIVNNYRKQLGLMHIQSLALSWMPFPRIHTTLTPNKKRHWVAKRQWRFPLSVTEIDSHSSTITI